MGAAGTGSPLFPAGYVGGMITLSDSNPQQLLALIQAQLDPNCPGAGAEINLQAGSGTLFVGRSSPIAGELSPTNFGYQLFAGDSRTYRTSFPGNHSPVGDLEVLMVGGGTFSVEVT
jgi:hypothetical protein